MVKLPGDSFLLPRRSLCGVCIDSEDGGAGELLLAAEPGLGSIDIGARGASGAKFLLEASGAALSCAAWTSCTTCFAGNMSVLVCAGGGVGLAFGNVLVNMARLAFLC